MYKVHALYCSFEGIRLMFIASCFALKASTQNIQLQPAGASHTGFARQHRHSDFKADVCTVAVCGGGGDHCCCCAHTFHRPFYTDIASSAFDWLVLGRCSLCQLDRITKICSITDTKLATYVHASSR